MQHTFVYHLYKIVQKCYANSCVPGGLKPRFSRVKALKVKIGPIAWPSRVDVTFLNLIFKKNCDWDYQAFFNMVYRCVLKLVSLGGDTKIVYRRKKFTHFSRLTINYLFS